METPNQIRNGLPSVVTATNNRSNRSVARLFASTRQVLRSRKARSAIGGEEEGGGGGGEGAWLVSEVTGCMLPKNVYI